MSEEKTNPRIIDQTELTYNSYLKVPELLELQQPQSDPQHHDEMLFIIIHQAYELWFKLILHELQIAHEKMGEGKVLRSRHFVRRSVEIMKLLVQQIHILETMAPAEFLKFRDKLNPASGFQSLQFREVEFFAGLKDKAYFRFFKNRPEYLEKLQARYDGPDLREAYFGLLTQLGFELPKGAHQVSMDEDSPEKAQILQALKKIYENPEDQLPIYLLSEDLIEFDETLALWREHHVRVVERVIGFKMGTGGSAGVDYLKRTTSKKAFPFLWEVRTHLE